MAGCNIIEMAPNFQNFKFQVALNQQQVMPQLAELHNVQEAGSVEEAAVREAETHGGQVDAHGQLQVHQQQPSSQQQPQHIIVTLQEPQQTMQHQVNIIDVFSQAP